MQSSSDQQVSGIQQTIQLAVILSAQSLAIIRVIFDVAWRPYSMLLAWPPRWASINSVGLQQLLKFVASRAVT
jgi:hypothetical protein